ncbi:MAG: hypothetical protein WD077_15120 [Bacteroidia bacterium]
MKKFQLYLVIAMSVCGFTLSLESCREACEGIDCGPHGTCEDGVCICHEAYSGVLCDQELPCFEIDCGQNGECNNGICSCNEGYTGERCEIIARNRFIGAWNVEDSCSVGGSRIYEAEILVDSLRLAGVLITGLAEVIDDPVSATIDDDELIITQQPGGNDLLVSGTGSISGEIISLDLMIENTATSSVDSCKSTWTK